MLRFLVIAFLLYLAYRFIFHFVIPVYRTSTRIKKQFREMHERMQAQQGGQTGTRPDANPQTKTTTRPDSRDYIEFEEIK